MPNLLELPVPACYPYLQISSAFLNRLLCLWAPPLDTGLEFGALTRELSRSAGNSSLPLPADLVAAALVVVDRSPAFSIAQGLLQSGSVADGVRMARTLTLWHGVFRAVVETRVVSVGDAFHLSLRTLVRTAKVARQQATMGVGDWSALLWSIHRNYISAASTTPSQVDLLWMLWAVGRGVNGTRDPFVAQNSGASRVQQELQYSQTVVSRTLTLEAEVSKTLLMALDKARTIMLEGTARQQWVRAFCRTVCTFVVPLYACTPKDAIPTPVDRALLDISDLAVRACPDCCTSIPSDVLTDAGPVDLGPGLKGVVSALQNATGGVGSRVRSLCEEIGFGILGLSGSASFHSPKFRLAGLGSTDLGGVLVGVHASVAGLEATLANEDVIAVLERAGHKSFHKAALEDLQSLRRLQVQLASLLGLLRSPRVVQLWSSVERELVSIHAAVVPLYHLRATLTRYSADECEAPLTSIIQSAAATGGVLRFATLDAFAVSHVWTAWRWSIAWHTLPWVGPLQLQAVAHGDLSAVFQAAVSDRLALAIAREALMLLSPYVSSTMAAADTTRFQELSSALVLSEAKLKEAVQESNDRKARCEGYASGRHDNEGQKKGRGSGSSSSKTRSNPNDCTDDEQEKQLRKIKDIQENNENLETSLAALCNSMKSGIGELFKKLQRLRVDGQKLRDEATKAALGTVSDLYAAIRRSLPVCREDCIGQAHVEDVATLRHSLRSTDPRVKFLGEVTVALFSSELRITLEDEGARPITWVVSPWSSAPEQALACVAQVLAAEQPDDKSGWRGMCTLIVWRDDPPFASGDWSGPGRALADWAAVVQIPVPAPSVEDAQVVLRGNVWTVALTHLMNETLHDVRSKLLGVYTHHSLVTEVVSFAGIFSHAALLVAGLGPAVRDDDGSVTLRLGTATTISVNALLGESRVSSTTAEKVLAALDNAFSVAAQAASSTCPQISDPKASFLTGVDASYKTFSYVSAVSDRDVLSRTANTVQNFANPELVSRALAPDPKDSDDLAAFKEDLRKLVPTTSRAAHLCATERLTLVANVALAARQLTALMTTVAAKVPGALDMVTSLGHLTSVVRPAFDRVLKSVATCPNTPMSPLSRGLVPEVCMAHALTMPEAGAMLEELKRVLVASVDMLASQTRAVGGVWHDQDVDVHREAFKQLLTLNIACLVTTVDSDHTGNQQQFRGRGEGAPEPPESPGDKARRNAILQKYDQLVTRSLALRHLLEREVSPVPAALHQQWGQLLEDIRGVQVSLSSPQSFAHATMRYSELQRRFENLRAPSDQVVREARERSHVLTRRVSGAVELCRRVVVDPQLRQLGGTQVGMAAMWSSTNTTLTAWEDTDTLVSQAASDAKVGFADLKVAVEYGSVWSGFTRAFAVYMGAQAVNRERALVVMVSWLRATLGSDPALNEVLRTLGSWRGSNESPQDVGPLLVNALRAWRLRVTTTRTFAATLDSIVPQHFMMPGWTPHTRYTKSSSRPGHALVLFPHASEFLLRHEDLRGAVPEELGGDSSRLLTPSGLGLVDVVLLAKEPSAALVHWALRVQSGLDDNLCDARVGDVRMWDVPPPDAMLSLLPDDVSDGLRSCADTFGKAVTRASGLNELCGACSIHDSPRLTAAWHVCIGSLAGMWLQEFQDTQLGKVANPAHPAFERVRRLLQSVQSELGALRRPLASMVNQAVGNVGGLLQVLGALDAWARGGLWHICRGDTHTRNSRMFEEPLIGDDDKRQLVVLVGESLSDRVIRAVNLVEHSVRISTEALEQLCKKGAEVPTSCNDVDIDVLAVGRLRQGDLVALASPGGLVHSLHTIFQSDFVDVSSFGALSSNNSQALLQAAKQARALAMSYQVALGRVDGIAASRFIERGADIAVRSAIRFSACVVQVAARLLLAAGPSNLSLEAADDWVWATSHCNRVGTDPAEQFVELMQAHASNKYADASGVVEACRSRFAQLSVHLESVAASQRRVGAASSMGFPVDLFSLVEESELVLVQMAAHPLLPLSALLRCTWESVITPTIVGAAVNGPARQARLQQLATSEGAMTRVAAVMSLVRSLLLELPSNLDWEQDKGALRSALLKASKQADALRALCDDFRLVASTTAPGLLAAVTGSLARQLTFIEAELFSVAQGIDMDDFKAGLGKASFVTSAVAASAVSTFTGGSEGGETEPVRLAHILLPTRLVMAMHAHAPALVMPGDGRVLARLEPWRLCLDLVSASLEHAWGGAEALMALGGWVTPMADVVQPLVAQGVSTLEVLVSTSLTRFADSDADRAPMAFLDAALTKLADLNALGRVRAALNSSLGAEVARDTVLLQAQARQLVDATERAKAASQGWDVGVQSVGLECNSLLAAHHRQEVQALATNWNTWVADMTKNVEDTNGKLEELQRRILCATREEAGQGAAGPRNASAALSRLLLDWEYQAHDHLSNWVSKSNADLDLSAPFGRSGSPLPPPFRSVRRVDALTGWRLIVHVPKGAGTPSDSWIQYLYKPVRKLFQGDSKDFTTEVQLSWRSESGDVLTSSGNISTDTADRDGAVLELTLGPLDLHRPLQLWVVGTFKYITSDALVSFSLSSSLPTAVHALDRGEKLKLSSANATFQLDIQCIALLAPTMTFSPSECSVPHDPGSLTSDVRALFSKYKLDALCCRQPQALWSKSCCRSSYSIDQLEELLKRQQKEASEFKAGFLRAVDATDLVKSVKQGFGSRGCTEAARELEQTVHLSTTSAVERLQSLCTCASLATDSLVSAFSKLPQASPTPGLTLEACPQRLGPQAAPGASAWWSQAMVDHVKAAVGALEFVCQRGISLVSSTLVQLRAKQAASSLMQASNFSQFNATLTRMQPLIADLGALCNPAGLCACGSENAEVARLQFVTQLADVAFKRLQTLRSDIESQYNKVQHVVKSKEPNVIFPEPGLVVTSLAASSTRTHFLSVALAAFEVVVHPPSLTMNLGGVLVDSRLPHQVLEVRNSHSAPVGVKVSWLTGSLYQGAPWCVVAPVDGAAVHVQEGGVVVIPGLASAAFRLAAAADGLLPPGDYHASFVVSAVPVGAPPRTGSGQQTTDSKDHSSALVSVVGVVEGPDVMVELPTSGALDFGRMIWNDDAFATLTLRLASLATQSRIRVRCETGTLSDRRAGVVEVSPRGEFFLEPGGGSDVVVRLVTRGGPRTVLSGPSALVAVVSGALACTVGVQGNSLQLPVTATLLPPHWSLLVQQVALPTAAVTTMLEPTTVAADGSTVVLFPWIAPGAQSQLALRLSNSMELPLAIVVFTTGMKVDCDAVLSSACVAFQVHEATVVVPARAAREVLLSCTCAASGVGSVGIVTKVGSTSLSFSGECHCGAPSLTFSALDSSGSFNTLSTLHFALFLDDPLATLQEVTGTVQVTNKGKFGVNIHHVNSTGGVLSLCGGARAAVFVPRAATRSLCVAVNAAACLTAGQRARVRVGSLVEGFMWLVIEPGAIVQRVPFAVSLRRPLLYAPPLVRVLLVAGAPQGPEHEVRVNVSIRNRGNCYLNLSVALGEVEPSIVMARLAEKRFGARRATLLPFHEAVVVPIVMKLNPEATPPALGTVFSATLVLEALNEPVVVRNAGALSLRSGSVVRVLIQGEVVTHPESYIQGSCVNETQTSQCLQAFASEALCASDKYLGVWVPDVFAAWDALTLKGTVPGARAVSLALMAASVGLSRCHAGVVLNGVLTEVLHAMDAPSLLVAVHRVVQSLAAGYGSAPEDAKCDARASFCVDSLQVAQSILGAASSTAGKHGVPSSLTDTMAAAAAALQFVERSLAPHR
jgi:hypothetical protein